MDPPLSSGETTEKLKVNINFLPKSIGDKTARLKIVTEDPNIDPFIFTLKGKGEKLKPALEFKYITGDKGLNKIANRESRDVKLYPFNGKLYAIWSEKYTEVGQIRVAVFGGDVDSKSWKIVDGNNPVGLNTDPSKDAKFPKLVSFKNSLYAVWVEGSSVRIKVYNEGASSWVALEDENNSLGSSYLGYEEAPDSIASNDKLYLTFIRGNGVEVLVYNNEAPTPGWLSISGKKPVDDTSTGERFDINRNTGENESLKNSRLLLSNNRLYVSWESKRSVHVAVFEGDKSAPKWKFLEGTGDSGLNKNGPENKSKQIQLLSFDNKIYAAWETQLEVGNDSSYEKQIAVFTGNDDSPSWQFVDGNSQKGLIKREGDTGYVNLYGYQCFAFKEKLYAIWSGSGQNRNQVHMAVYNNDDTSPSWDLVDGGTVFGFTGSIDSYSRGASYPYLVSSNNKLYATWLLEDSEDNKQIRKIEVVEFGL